MRQYRDGVGIPRVIPRETLPRQPAFCFEKEKGGRERQRKRKREREHERKVEEKESQVPGDSSPTRAAIRPRGTTGTLWMLSARVLGSI